MRKRPFDLACHHVYRPVNRRGNVNDGPAPPVIRPLRPKGRRRATGDPRPNSIQCRPDGASIPRLQNKTALVTGGARAFRDEGAEIILTDIDVENGEVSASEMGATFCKLDVSSATN